ncbi:MAG: Uncharacterised protein [Cryomorphaceae bacterium]|nr:MAG: Uncharacterised protein [Cryomorphaceae bacterium]
MKTIFTTLILCVIFINNGIAQQISSEAYSYTEILEDFSQEGNIFPIINTTKNQFIIDNGDYFLSRNDKDSQHTITANNSPFSDFILKTSIRIGPSNNKNASIGIILKAQQKQEGAIIFEINKNGEYRIKQLLNNTYKTINGVSKNEGWIKSKLIKLVNEHNLIEIRIENNAFDVYVNNEYLTTFINSDYTNGSCGFVISPETKARIAYYHIITKGKSTADKIAYSSNTNTSIEELNNKITLLEKNNVKLNLLNTEGKENQRLELKSLRKEINNQADIKIEQEKEIASLNRTITSLKSKSTSSTNKQQTDKIEALKQKITIEKSVNTNLNEATLTSELKYANQEISTLQKTKNKQGEIVNDINSQLSLLKAKQLDLKYEVQTLKKKTSNLEKINIELKELFILKDFEANGVKPSDLIKSTNPYSTPKELKGNSTIYAVQFGVFMQVQAYSTLKVLDDVWYEKTEHGTFVYLSGQFKNPKVATAHKNKVAALGYPNAFVVTLRK